MTTVGIGVTAITTVQVLLSLLTDVSSRMSPVEMIS